MTTLDIEVHQVERGANADGMTSARRRNNAPSATVECKDGRIRLYRYTAQDEIWLIPTVEKLNELRRLTASNWSAGAKPIDISAINSMLELLTNILPNDAPPPTVVPTWDGGVQVEWHRNGIDLEIEVSADRESEYYFFDHQSNEEIEGEAPGNLDQLSEYAKKLRQDAAAPAR